MDGLHAWLDPNSPENASQGFSEDFTFRRQSMPRVNGKEYPYTKAGKAAAKKAKKKAMKKKAGKKK